MTAPLVTDVTYSVTFHLELDRHGENAALYPLLLKEAASDPTWTGGEPGTVRATWDYTTPGPAQELHDRLIQHSVCGLTVDLAMTTSWSH